VTPPAIRYYLGDDEYGLERAALALGQRAAGLDGEPPMPWRTTGAGSRAADIASASRRRRSSAAGRS
jgi:hypothetical protein